jgi:hypothetical protein
MSRFEGYIQIKTKRERADDEFIRVGKNYVSFSKPLTAKYKDRYVGFFIDKVNEKIIIHASKEKEIGYFHSSRGAFSSVQVVEAFSRLGYSAVARSAVIIGELNFIDDDTIEVGVMK